MQNLDVVVSCTYMYRINELILQKRPYYHTQDLAVIWGITNKNTLYKTISRHLKRGVLRSVQKGFYVTVPLDQIDATELGTAYLHTFAYLSTESVLAASGIINQNPEAITLVSSVSKNFKLGEKTYKVRKLKDQFLLNDQGLINKGSYLVASPARAVADLLHFDPKYYLDNKNLVNSTEMAKIQREVYGV